MLPVLLFTSCVTPGNMSFTVISDPGQRRAEYIDSLQYYLDNTNYRIVVVDNSGYTYDEFSDVDPSRLEILSFYGNDYPKGLGKGYGEGMIIRHAIENSVILKGYDGPVAKVSGRHMVQNIRLLTSWYSFVSLLCKKCFYAIVLECEKWVISDFFIAPLTFYKQLVIELVNVNDSRGYYFEHCLYDNMVSSRKMNSIRVLHMPLPLKQIGISGTTGKRLTMRGSAVKYMIKSIIYALRLDSVFTWYHEKC